MESVYVKSSKQSSSSVQQSESTSISSSSSTSAATALQQQQQQSIKSSSSSSSSASKSVSQAIHQGALASNAAALEMIQKAKDLSLIGSETGSQAYQYAASEFATSSSQMINDNGKVSGSSYEAGGKMVDDNGMVSKTNYETRRDIPVQFVTNGASQASVEAAKNSNISHIGVEANKLKPVITSAIILTVEDGQITDCSKGK
jgi:hypothetical protein